MNTLGLSFKMEYVPQKPKYISMLREIHEKTKWKSTEESIKSSAVMKQDMEILPKIQSIDLVALVALEAHYHASCQRNYTRTIARQWEPEIHGGCAQGGVR